MANDYYNHGGWPSFKASGASAPARSEFDAITAGFDKLPGVHPTRPGFNTPVEVGAPSTPTQAAQSGSVLALAGGTLTGDVSITKTNPALSLRKSATGQENYLYGYQGANKHWSVILGDATSRSAFSINRFDDAGSLLGTSFRIDRDTGDTTVTTTPTGTDNPLTVVATHNSQQAVRAINSSTGASAAISVRVETNAGVTQINQASTAAGGAGAVVSSGAAGLSVSAAGPLYITADAGLRMTVSSSGVDLKDGAGSLKLNGHVSRYESPVEGVISGSGAYTVRAVGTRRPDVVQIFLQNKTAQNGYTAGDVTTPTSSSVTYFWNVEDAQMRLLQTATPTVANALSGVNSAITPANWDIFFVLHWL